MRGPASRYKPLHKIVAAAISVAATAMTVLMPTLTIVTMAVHDVTLAY